MCQQSDVFKTNIDADCTEALIADNLCIQQFPLQMSLRICIYVF